MSNYTMSNYTMSAIRSKMQRCKISICQSLKLLIDDHYDDDHDDYDNDEWWWWCIKRQWVRVMMYHLHHNIIHLTYLSIYLPLRQKSIMADATDLSICSVVISKHSTCRITSTVIFSPDLHLTASIHHHHLTVWESSHTIVSRLKPICRKFIDPMGMMNK